MRRLRTLLLPDVTLALLLAPAGLPAAAQGPDHLHLDVRHVDCGRLEVSGFHLPGGSQLDLRYVDAGTSRVLHQASARTSPTGRLVTGARVSLNGVETVRVLVSRSGSARSFAFGEQTIAERCRLPFTGPRSGPLAVLGAASILAGLMLLAGVASRGRHLPGR